MLSMWSNWRIRAALRTDCEQDVGVTGAGEDQVSVGEVVALRALDASHGRLVDAVDLTVGAGVLAWSVAERLGAIAFVAARPFVRLALRPPLLTRDLAPEAVLRRLTRTGARVRVETGVEVEEVSRRLVPAVAGAVLARIDLTELVLANVDLVRVVEAVLDRIDLTDLVLQRVDLERVVAAVDVDEVAARLDLVGIANYLVDEIDLSEIIRVSTGSVATEAVRGVRMQTIDADGQVQRVVDRVLLRRRARRTQGPHESVPRDVESLEDGSAEQ